jgi:hypothetical protein
LIREQSALKKKAIELFGEIKSAVLPSMDYLIDIFFIGSLKMTGRLKEFGQFLYKKNNLIEVTNHSEGIEWAIIYYHFFRPIYVFKPKLLLREVPRVLADRINFRHFLSGPIEPIVIPIDRDQNGEALESSRVRSRYSSVRRGIRALEQTPLITFPEGTRTYKAVKIYSPKKGKPLGKLNRSLDLLVYHTRADVGVGWLEYPGLSYHFLAEDGRFRLRRLIIWWILMILGMNGRIVCVWGEKKHKELIEKGKGVAEQVEDYMLELADTV